MRLDLYLHFPERFYTMADANLQAQFDRATAYITTLQGDLSTANSTVASLSTALAGADTGEDDADATELSTALDGVGAPSLSTSASASVSASVSTGTSSVSISAPFGTGTVSLSTAS